MAEINVKSPALKDREIGTYRLSAKVTLSGAYCACCGCCSTIDIPGLSISAVCGAVDKFSLSGFECVSGLALDTSREAGLLIANTGALTGVTEAEIGAGVTIDGAISGTAGSRVVTFQLGGAYTTATDALTGAIMEFILPVKNADF